MSRWLLRRFITQGLWTGLLFSIRCMQGLFTFEDTFSGVTFAGRSLRLIGKGATYHGWWTSMTIKGFGRS